MTVARHALNEHKTIGSSYVDIACSSKAKQGRFHELATVKPRIWARNWCHESWNRPSEADKNHDPEHDEQHEESKKTSMAILQQKQFGHRCPKKPFP